MSKKYVKSVKAISDDELYMLSPKGCAFIAMFNNELVYDFEDEKFEKFWDMFEHLMRKNNYINED